jgi:hypothetical protein
VADWSAGTLQEVKSMMVQITREAVECRSDAVQQSASHEPQHISELMHEVLARYELTPESPRETTPCIAVTASANDAALITTP